MRGFTLSTASIDSSDSLAGGEGRFPRGRVRLMGMPIDPVTQGEAVGHILSSLAAGRGGWVITPNLDHLRLFRKHAHLRPMYEEAELVLPDGMPLLWASKVRGTPLPARVPGSELIYTLTEAAAREGRSVFLLGGNPGAADGAAEVLKQKYPGLKVAGTYCPPFGFEKSAAETEVLRERLVGARPDIVFVGLGFPKQERLIERVKGLLPGAWFLGVGISFSFVSGEVKRAPRWIQAVGMEWAHRMGQEPGRLFKRYVVYGVPFGVRLMGSAVWGRLRG